MSEFINLDETQDDTIITNVPSTQDTTSVDTSSDSSEESLDLISLDTITLDTTESTTEDSLCVKNDCDIANTYKCKDINGYFLVDNLFSELTDDYQREVAKKNLGIGTAYSLIWGNISGNLVNQKDLYNFVLEETNDSANNIISQINTKLASLTSNFTDLLNSKANIYSPILTGDPQTVTPSSTNNSKSIANTEWVVNAIESAKIAGNIKAISISPEYIFYGDSAADVIVTWNYYKDVDSQTINGIVLDKALRTYTFSKLSSTTVITLSYTYSGTSETKTITFSVKYPIYYGVSNDYTKLSKTLEFPVTVTAGTNEYIYVIIPNGSKVELMVNSIVGGFISLGTQSIFNNIYYIYRSEYTNLGETTIELLTTTNIDTDTLDGTTIKELLATKPDKSEVYTKVEANTLLDEIKNGGIDLSNYYTKAETLALIPDTSIYALKSSIPTKLSAFTNDTGFITSIPSEYITKTELLNKNYLTSESEPLFKSSVVYNITSTDISNWNNKVDKISGLGLSEQSYTTTEKTKLSGLSNYDDTAVRTLISDLTNTVNTKANLSDIPSLTGYAKLSDIPTKVSAFTNDANYLTTIPSEYITETELNAKGYLTSYTETDPTVSAWAKASTKPTYTYSEVGADATGAADTALASAKTYTDTCISSLIDSEVTYITLKKIGDAIRTNLNSISTINTTLSTKADKSKLFSGNYNDLTNKPTIPSLDGYATQSWVTTKIAAIDYSTYATKTDLDTKVDKVNGKVLSSNDFTDTLLAKLNSLSNYDDTSLKASIPSNLSQLTNNVGFVTQSTLDSYYLKTDADSTFLKQSAISSWALASTKPSYTSDEITEGTTNLYFTSSRVHTISDIPVVSSTETSLAIDPNKFYVFGTVTSLTITLNDPTSTTIYNEYMFQFTSDSTTATTLTLPSTVKYINSVTIETGKTYQVSIVNNLAVIGGA